MTEINLNQALAELLERYKPFNGHVLLDAAPGLYDRVRESLQATEPRGLYAAIVGIMSAGVIPDVLRVLPETSWTFQAALAVRDHLAVVEEQNRD